MVSSEEPKKQAQEDESFRNAIEGKFGQAKRRFRQTDPVNILIKKRWVKSHLDN